MHHLKVDQPRTIGSRIVNNIVQMRIAVRPPIFELGTPESVCPPKLSPGGFERTGRKRAVVQVLAQMHPGNCIHADGSRTLGERTESGFLEQTKAIYFPALPFLGIDPDVNAALSQAKE